MDGWMDGWMGGQMDGWMDGWVDERIDDFSAFLSHSCDDQYMTHVGLQCLKPRLTLKLRMTSGVR